MLRHHLGELGEAARIFGFEREPHRKVGVFVSGHCDRLKLEHRGDVLAELH